MHRQHHTPQRELSPRTERVLSVLLACAVGLALAEALCQWAMGWGVI